MKSKQVSTSFKRIEKDNNIFFLNLEGEKSFVKYLTIVNLYPLPSKYRFPLQNVTIPLKHLQTFYCFQAM
jgi:hypothetical protein